MTLLLGTAKSHCMQLLIHQHLITSVQVLSLITFFSLDQAGKDPALCPSPLAPAGAASHRTEGFYLCSRVHIHALGEHIGVGDEPHEIVDIAFNTPGNTRILDLHGRLAPVMQGCSMHLFTQHKYIKTPAQMCCCRFVQFYVNSQGEQVK